MANTKICAPLRWFSLPYCGGKRSPEIIPTRLGSSLPVLLPESFWGTPSAITRTQNTQRDALPAGGVTLSGKAVFVKFYGEIFAAFELFLYFKCQTYEGKASRSLHFY